MHAIVIIARMDAARYAEQRQELEERIVPLTRHQPGFQWGAWAYDREAGRSFSVITLDTEDAARRFAAFVADRTSAPEARRAGVEVESVSVAEVMAEAHRPPARNA
jgi:hypothetical protein